MNKILPFATGWMDLEGIILSEISQRKTNIKWYNSYVEFKKYSAPFSKDLHKKQIEVKLKSV